MISVYVLVIELPSWSYIEQNIKQVTLLDFCFEILSRIPQMLDWELEVEYEIYYFLPASAFDQNVLSYNHKGH